MDKRPRAHPPAAQHCAPAQQYYRPVQSSIAPDDELHLRAHQLNEFTIAVTAVFNNEKEVEYQVSSNGFEHAVTQVMGAPTELPPQAHEWVRSLLGKGVPYNGTLIMKAVIC